MLILFAYLKSAAVNKLLKIENIIKVGSEMTQLQFYKQNDTCFQLDQKYWNDMIGFA